MIDLLRLAWRNLWRHKRRSLLTLLAVAFAVFILMFSMSWQRGSYAEMIHNTVRARTGHLQVQRPGYWPDGELTRYLHHGEELLPALRDLPHVAGAAPRVNTAALVAHSNRTFGALLLGVDPATEGEVSSLPTTVRQGAFLEPDDLDGAVLGHGLATNLGVSVGDEIVFVGQGADGSFAAGTLVVRGLFKTGVAESDRSTLAMHIRTLQQAASMPDGVTELALLLDSDRHRPKVATALQGALAAAGRSDDAAVIEWPVLLPGIEQSTRLDWVSGLILYALLVLVVGFGIANTFLMAYLERRYEFGVLLAVGMRPRLLSALLYLESLLLIGCGVLTGLAVGLPFVAWLQEIGIKMPIDESITSEYGLSTIVHPQLSGLVLGWAVGLVFGIAALVAVLPALRAARLTPVEAFRSA